MHWKSAAFALITLASAPLPAIAQEAHFISAEPSPLKRSAFIAPNETRFSGNAQVSGQVEFSWGPPSNGHPGLMRIVFRPDAASRKILPHEAGRGPARELWISNTDTAIAALVTPSQLKTLTAKRQTVAGNATLIITAYRSAVDCDTRGYEAELVSAVRLPLALGPTAKAQQAPRC